jgi:phospholipid/cholesterol/gamma-HCH transport system permease protein
MTILDSPALNLTSPIGWVGRRALGLFAYLGGMAAILASAGRSLFRIDASHEPIYRSVSNQLAWMISMSLPLVALVHVGMGSFLSMQSYFGGTFVEGTGAVVGVGLLRNIAPMMACLTLTGLLAARVTPELRMLSRESGTTVRARPTILERTGPLVREAAPPLPFRADREIAARLIAATLMGPILGIWGALVGTVVGWQVAQTMLGVSSHSFFSMFWEMIWVRDVVGVLVKGLAFGLVAGLFVCHEGLRKWDDDGLDAVASAAFRAACFASLSILVINSGWFILVYHAGPAFGPTLLAPATP